MRLGIDFGTCFSSAAFVDGGTLSFVKDPSSVSFSVPSSVFATPQGQVLVGKAANNQRLKDPLSYRRELKRDLGKSNPLLLGSHAFMTEQLIARVLGKIRSDANMQMKSIGKPLFTGAVLTIPATYQEHKRTLMLKAAIQAGFGAEELTLLEEPVAAALYYAQQSNMADGEVLLVYDLGGGTFDTALLQKKGESFDYLALPAGIERCGGIDFDRAIYTDLIRHHPELRDILQGERNDKAALAARVTVGEMCIDLKHQLSDVDEAELSMVVPGSGDFIEYALTRTAFQQMIAPTIQETITCSEHMLQQANISHEQLNRILLVGGSCRIPYVQQKLKQTFKCPISAAPDLELVVCQGAALDVVRHKIYVVSATPGEAEFTTIGAALQQAKPKSSIVVRPGTYQESLVLDREVGIIGVGAREGIIITSSAAIGIKMATSNALIRGMTLQHTGSEAVMWNTHGGVVVAQGHLTLEDCSIEAAVQGVSIWGPEGKATLRRCLIRADKNASVAINNGGQGIVEHCEIAYSTEAGIHVRDKHSCATIRHCHIHNGQAVGISISAEGQALMEDCDIAENAAAGIQIREEKSSATIRHSRIHNGKDKGIAVWQKGQVFIEEGCDIFENMHAGILVGDEGSKATIKQSKVRDGKFVGIEILRKGDASIEASEIFGNAGAGIRTRGEGSRITVTQCQLHDGKYAGIVIQDKGQATLGNSHVFRNVGPGIRICNAGSKAAISECDIQGNAAGVMLEDESEATVKDSAIEKNRTNMYIEPGSTLQFLPAQDASEPASNVMIWRQTPRPEPIKHLLSIKPEAITLIRTIADQHYFIAISPDGKTVANGRSDNTVKLWDLQTGQLLRTLTGHSSYVYSVAIGSDGQMLVSGSNDKTVRLWNVQTGQLIRTFTGHTNLVYRVAVSPDGQILASGSFDNTVRLWNMQTGQPIRTLTGYTSYIRSLVISPDGQMLASGSDDKTIKLWNLYTGELLHTLEHTGPVYALIISPDWQTLISGSNDNTIKLWNIHTGQLLRTLTGHSAAVISLAMSIDEQFLISGSHDKTIKIWNLHTGELVRTLIEPTAVQHVAMSRDGQTLVSGDGSTIKIWGKQ